MHRLLKPDIPNHSGPSGLLVRVAIDSSEQAGSWNAPCSESGDFCYVPILSHCKDESSLARRYHEFEPAINRFRKTLPANLSNKRCHLDPDFQHLTYGDGNRRANRIREVFTNPHQEDFLVFYAGLRLMDGVDSGKLVYAIIGFYTIRKIIDARDVPEEERYKNAHTRCKEYLSTNDVLVLANPSKSGRLRKFISIGEYRDGAYRVKNDILQAWGRLRIRN
jgi:hypothetical protein